MCKCDDSLIRHIEGDFKRSLQLQRTLEQWAQWLEGVVEKVLHFSGTNGGAKSGGNNAGAGTSGGSLNGSFGGGSSSQPQQSNSSARFECNPESFTKQARQFLLNWSFYRWATFLINIFNYLIIETNLTASRCALSWLWSWLPEYERKTLLWQFKQSWNMQCI